jgi:hypothetical protein
MMIGYVEYVTKPRSRAVAKINPAILDDYVGEYEILPGRTMTIGRSGDNLIAGSKGFPTAPIFPESETKFFLTAADVDITFVKNEKGEVTEIVIDQGGRTFHAKRVSSTQTKPDTGK